MTERPVLSVEKLTISFPGDTTFVAVDEISFDIAKGETLAIVGESGSGKSLTALSLLGLLPKAAQIRGSIELYDGNVKKLTALPVHEWSKLRGKAVSMVFQEPMSALNPVMKIGRQLSESILAHNSIPAAAAKTEAIEWLAKVQLPNPATIYNRYPHQLSGGQKQRVMIAMAMCNKPALLVADEPTTALDVTVQREIIELISSLQKQEHTAMIFITHDLSLAAAIADKVLVMYQGRAMEYGSAEKVLKYPAHAYTKALLACRPSATHKGQKLPVVSDFLEPGKPSNDAGSYKTDYSHLPAGDVLLRVNGLRVWFAEEKNWLGVPRTYFKAVDDVSFDLRQGEVLGLVGESGSGKSTIGRSLVGLLPVREGQVMFDGQDLTNLNSAGWKKVRREIQLIFQDPFASLNPRMTVGDMLREPLRAHNIVPAADREKEVKRLLDLVHLPADTAKRYPHQFSGGQRQRLGIARALALKPKLLICDESVSALDVSIQAQILNLLKELQGEFNLSYLFVSHDLSVVHYISDRVMVMKAGRIVETGEAQALFDNPRHEYTQKLINAALD